MISLLSDDRQMLDAWDDYVLAHPRASHYHLSQWKQVIESVFGHQCCYFIAQDESGEIQGVMPLVRLKSRLFGDYMVSMPFFNYGGAIGRDAEIELELMAHAAAKAEQLGVGHIEFRDMVRREGYPCKEDKVSMVLELPENEDQLWKQLGAKRRSQINRPLRENPVIKEGANELLDDFYDVFSKNMRDLGTPVYAKHFFEMMLNQFPNDSRLIVIYLKGKPVGGAFLLGFLGTLEIPWASTLREVNALSINMLMYWEVIKYAYRRSYKAFDFGRCTVGGGTYRFKKQWGAIERASYWHYWLPAGQPLPSLNPNNPKYKLAISIWKNLPLFVTKFLGPGIVKNLP